MNEFFNTTYYRNIAILKYVVWESQKLQFSVTNKTI